MFDHNHSFCDVHGTWFVNYKPASNTPLWVDRTIVETRCAAYFYEYAPALFYMQNFPRTSGPTEPARYGSYQLVLCRKDLAEWFVQNNVRCKIKHRHHGDHMRAEVMFALKQDAVAFKLMWL